MEHFADIVREFAYRYAGDRLVPWSELIDACVAETPLEALARRQGVEVDQAFAEVITREPRLWLSPRGVCRFELVLDEVVFTHRVGVEERDGHYLLTQPDLDVLRMDLAELRTSSGEALSYRIDGLQGPAGWLRGVDPGDLIAVRRRRGIIQIERIEDAHAGSSEGELLAEGYESHAEEGAQAVPTAVVVAHAVDTDPTAFRTPVRPISDLLAEHDLATSGNLVGPIGTDFEAETIATELDEHYSVLIDTYDLDDCCRDELDLLIGAVVGPEAQPPDRGLTKALDHGMVTYAFFEWLDQWAPWDVRVAFIGGLTARNPRSSAARVLRSLHLVEDAQPREAITELEAALAADPDHRNASIELAYLMIAASDYRRASSLLSRIGASESALAELAGRFRGAGEAVGRNEPCPCGSGRKYKVCHLGTVDLEPRDQVSALIRKAALYLGHPLSEHPVARLADVSTDSDEIFERLVDDTFFIQTSLFDGGLLAEYLERMADILPVAEREVFEVWADTPLRLWRVESTDHGSVTTVVDTKSAERITVEDRAMAQSSSIGDLVLARFVPYAGSWWAAGDGVAVDLRIRDSAMALLDSDPDAEDIGSWYASLFDAPTILTREGEVVVAATARLAPRRSPAAVVDALDERYEQDPGDPSVWHELRALPGGERVLRATLAVEGNEVVVTTNAAERLERVIADLADVATVLQRSVEPISTLAGFAEAMAAPRPGSLSGSIGDEDRMRIIAEMEDRWLSESIPALGGATPREAAADRTRIDDLRRLLDSFPAPPPPPGMSMDPSSLRRKLGLD